MLMSSLGQLLSQPAQRRFLPNPAGDADHFYRYLTTQVAGLPGIHHVATAPTVRTLKRIGTIDR